MNQRRLAFSIILASIIVIILSLITLIIPNSNTNSKSKIESLTIPINFLIDNSANELPETKKLDRAIINFMRYWDLKGASFALMRGDSLLYAKGYGYANKEQEQRCDVHNTFRIASISKLITATAIMKLADDNMLSLDTKVFGEQGVLNDSLFLDFNNKKICDITVEHLLRHTAGFSTPIGDAAFANYSVSQTIGKPLPLSLDDMVLYATKNRMRAAPGQRYDYSNLGYIVLSKVIEKVTRQSYESYVQDSILKPAGCYDMYIGRNYPEDRRANEVNYYEVKEAEAVDAFDGSSRTAMKSNGGNNVTLLSGAGGWVSSPVELLKFVAAINGEGEGREILSCKARSIMIYEDEHTKPIGWSSVNGGEWMRSGSMSGTTALIKRQSNGYTWVFVANTSTWVGPRHSKYISATISRALSGVRGLPERNLFESTPSDSLGSMIIRLLNFNEFLL